MRGDAGARGCGAIDCIQAYTVWPVRCWLSGRLGVVSTYKQATGQSGLERNAKCWCNEQTAGPSTAALTMVL